MIALRGGGVANVVIRAVELRRLLRRRGGGGGGVSWGWRRDTSFLVGCDDCEICVWVLEDRVVS